MANKQTSSIEYSGQFCTSSGKESYTRWGEEGETGIMLAGPNKVYKEATLVEYNGDTDKSEEGTTEDNMDPSRPFLVLKKIDFEKMDEGRWPRRRAVGCAVAGLNGGESDCSLDCWVTHDAREKAVRKETPRGWDQEYSRRMFFPYWRSILGAKRLVRVYPSYVPTPLSDFDISVLWKSRSDSTTNESSQKPNQNLGRLGRLQQPVRPFSSAAFTVFKKALRK